MSRDALPDDVAAFLRENVRSLMALELLLLLQREPSREWTAAELFKELRAGPEWTERELQELTQRGLLSSSESWPTSYRYAPRTPEMGAVVSKLSSLYPEWRFSILQTIFSAPSEPIQSFADAFRLRKDQTDG